MVSEPAARYLIRTAEGDKGPYTTADIVGFLNQGKLKPNVRVLDQVSGQAVLVAQIAREKQGPPGPTTAPPVPHPPVSAPAQSTQPSRQVGPPRPAPLPPSPSDLVREQRDRTTAAFSRKDLAVEVASADSIDIPADIIADAHSRSGSGDQFSSVPRQPGSGDRHEKPATQRPSRSMQRTGRGSRDGSRRLRSGGGDVGAEADFDDEQFEGEVPRRGRRRRQQRLIIGGIIGGIALVLTVLGILVAQQVASERVILDPQATWGSWTVDNEAMIAAGKDIDQFSFGQFVIEGGTLQTCNGKRWTYQVERNDRERLLDLSLVATDGTRDKGSAFIRGERLWLTMPLPGYRAKTLILRRGAPPLDSAAEMKRIQERSDPTLFNKHAGTASAPVQEP